MSRPSNTTVGACTALYLAIVSAVVIALSGGWVDVMFWAILVPGVAFLGFLLVGAFLNLLWNVWRGYRDAPAHREAYRQAGGVTAPKDGQP